MIQGLISLFEGRPRTAEAWLARMGRERVSARDHAAFLLWLEQDEDHLRQYEAAKADRTALAPLRGQFGADLAALRAGRARRTRPRALAAGALVAAGLAAAMLVAPQLLAPAVQTETYSAAPGRITDVMLADGSRVSLDQGSAIEVALAEDVRRVRLVRGAAFFDVAHDAAHPFQVSVADRRVMVTGTRFQTVLRGDVAEVSLLDGRVAIGRRDMKDRRALDGAARLRPGDRAVFRVGVPGERVDRTDVEAATAWRHRRLVFRDAPLTQIIAAAAPYADRPLVASDARLSAVRATVVLPLEGKGTLVERMDDLLPIAVDFTPQGEARIRAE